MECTKGFEKNRGYRENWRRENRTSLVLKAANESLASMSYMENEITTCGITE
jgi:hypothetical protein